MTNLTNEALALIIASLEADANNFDLTVESREGARTMVKRYQREEARRALAAYYSPLPSRYADGTPTGA